MCRIAERPQSECPPCTLSEGSGTYTYSVRRAFNEKLQPSVAHICKVVCLIILYFCWFFFSCHLKALELLQGLFQPVWLVFSHPLSSVRHSHHAKCRRFFTLASRGTSSFKLLGWIPLVSPEVLFSLTYLCLHVVFFMVWKPLNGDFLFLQVWGCWHLCCDVLGDHENTGPYRDAVLLPDVSIQLGVPCSDAQPGKSKKRNSQNCVRLNVLSPSSGRNMLQCL